MYVELKLSYCLDSDDIVITAVMTLSQLSLSYKAKAKSKAKSLLFISSYHLRFQKQYNKKPYKLTNFYILWKCSVQPLTSEAYSKHFKHPKGYQPLTIFAKILHVISTVWKRHSNMTSVKRIPNKIIFDFLLQII